LPDILLGPCGCAFSRFDINRTSGSQVMAIYLPNRWQDTVLWRHNWRHVTIDAGDLSMCLFKVWYRNSSSVSAVFQVFPKLWQDTVLWRHKKMFFFFFFLHVRARTYGHALVFKNYDKRTSHFINAQSFYTVYNWQSCFLRCLDGSLKYLSNSA